MKLNLFGRLVENQWKKLPRFFRHVSLDVFQFMPNHMHGIIIMHKRLEAKKVAQQVYRGQCRGTVPGAIPAIIQNYCSSTTTKINNIRHTPGLKFWQRNYYEHIIRSEREFQRIRRYIMANPARWGNDIFHR